MESMLVRAAELPWVFHHKDVFQSPPPSSPSLWTPILSKGSVSHRSDGTLRMLASPVRPIEPKSRCFSAIGANSIEADKKAKSDAKIYDEQTLVLKEKGREIVDDLKGNCIYLTGMMGSGKSTIGKLVADALGYSFVDSDKVIEEAAGGITVAQLFQQQTEESFRDSETEVLRKLSSNVCMVIATGGGIVIREVNWNYLRHGVTVFLDVPLEILAERVVAAGTGSRPLLGESNGMSAYEQALCRLTSIFTSRASCYAKADVIVSLKSALSEYGYSDARDLTPADIAALVLDEIKKSLILKKQRGVSTVTGSS